MVTAQQWLQKWGNNLNAAGPYIKSGVQAVQTAPGVSAAAAQDRMLAGVQASVTSGKWARNVSAVSLQSWQNAMINKGMGRIAAGVTQAQTSATSAITTLLNNVQTAVAAANQLPKGGLQQGIARAVAYMNAMSAASAQNNGQ
jgi:hypothetical protein